MDPQRSSVPENAPLPDIYVGGAEFGVIGEDGLGRILGGGADSSLGAGAGTALLRFRVLSDNYAYLLVQGREANAIDPGDAGPISRFIGTHGLLLVRILVTHHHADHTGGCLALKKASKCEVLGPPDPRIPVLDRALGDGERLDRAAGRSLEIESLHVPGHTRTHMAYEVRLENGRFLFSGDCLFPAGCGRVIEGTCEEMLKSLRRLSAGEKWALGDTAAPGGACRQGELPTAVLLPGHEYTLENLAFALSLQPGDRRLSARRERFHAAARDRGAPPSSLLPEEPETNPFLRTSEPSLKKALGMEGASDVEVFGEIRRRKDRFLFP